MTLKYLIKHLVKLNELNKHISQKYNKKSKKHKIVQNYKIKNAKSKSKLSWFMTSSKMLLRYYTTKIFDCFIKSLEQVKNLIKFTVL